MQFRDPLSFLSLFFLQCHCLTSHSLLCTCTFDSSLWSAVLFTCLLMKLIWLKKLSVQCIRIEVEVSCFPNACSPFQHDAALTWVYSRVSLFSIDYADYFCSQFGPEWSKWSLPPEKFNFCNFSGIHFQINVLCINVVLTEDPPTNRQKRKIVLLKIVFAGGLPHWVQL